MHRTGIPGIVMLALPLVTTGAASAATSVLGTPVVQQDTDFSDGDQGFHLRVSTNAVIDQALSSTPVELEIMFEDMQSVQLFDSDPDFDGIGMTIRVENPTPDDLPMQFVVDFLDENGGVITPPALAADGFGSQFSLDVSANSALIGFGRIFRAELMDALSFYGVRVGITGPGDLTWRNLTEFVIANVDDTSRVIPEPGTLTLCVCGLLVASSRRRRPRGKRRRRHHES